MDLAVCIIKGNMEFWFETQLQLEAKVKSFESLLLPYRSSSGHVSKDCQSGSYHLEKSPALQEPTTADTSAATFPSAVVISSLELLL